MGELMGKYILAVDGMGGDNAPKSIIEGIAEFLRHNDDCDIRLFGKSDVLRNLLNEFNDIKDRIAVIDCPEVITMQDEPMMAVRRKQNSSLIAAIRDVRDGVSQAVLSAGSTGALFLGSMVNLKMIKGIARPALATVLPGKTKPVLLLDCGANADCQSQYLVQFGLMGAAYMQQVLGVAKPEAGLINIGTESEKGSRLYKEAYKLLTEQRVFKFNGNCEAREIHNGGFDVVIADGFTGNVVLKYAEGFAGLMVSKLKQTIMATLNGRIGGLLLKKQLKGFKKLLTADEYGGAPLVGVNGIVVKVHGSCSAYAFSKALEQARLMIIGDIVGLIKQGINDMNQNAETGKEL